MRIRMGRQPDNSVSHYVLLFISFLFLVLVSCRTTPNNEVTPIQETTPTQETISIQRDLSQLNCQLGDLTNGRYDFTETDEPPSPTLFGEEIIHYHQAKLDEMSLSYQSIRCEIMVFADDAAAQQVFAQVRFQEPTTEAVTDLGEEACSFGEGIVTLTFRQDEALVVILADLNGAGIFGLAQAIEKRLTDH